jgi:RND family efflux transporter MFP subunit
VTLVKLTRKALRIGSLVAVTALAIGLMGLVSTGSLNLSNSEKTDGQAEGLLAVQPVVVEVMEIKEERAEILDLYSGMIRPWERYTLGFETAGRIESLGANLSGLPLDDGDSVTKGQLLARLDDRVLRARESETAARLEQATSDFDRVKKVESQKIGAISDADVQQRLTALATAKAAHEMAVKNLEDAQLVAPVDAVVSKRLVNPGESVAANVPTFELIEVDRVLLVLGVPESDIPDIQTRMRQVQRNRSLPDKTGIDEEDLEFEARVELIGRNRFGKEVVLAGTVYRISETADDRTGLFEVEVELSNKDRKLRPGMIARVDLVVNRVDGRSIPTSSMITPSESEARQASGAMEEFVFTFEPLSAAESVDDRPTESMQGRAHRVELNQWVEQRENVVVTQATAPIHWLIWRGQHRLTDGQLVERIPLKQPPSED